MKRSHLAVIIAVVALVGVLFLPISVPLRLVVPGKIMPAREWTLLRDQEGSIGALLRDHTQGTVQSYALNRFERGDAVRLTLHPAIRPRVYVEAGDTIASNLDLLISNIENTPSLYENPMGQGHWLKVELEGTVSNRDAFGTVVEVWAGGAVHRRYHHGAQFLGQNMLPVHVGLGEAGVVERIAITWPSGHVDDVGSVLVDQTIQIKETVGLVAGEPTSIDDEPTVPGVLRVLGNYPNPFNNATQIRFALDAPGEVELTIFDALGRTVDVLKRSYSTAGEKMLPWNATDENGILLGSGLYFYRVHVNHAGAGYATGAMLYIK